MDQEIKASDEQIERNVIAALNSQLGDDAVQIEVRVKDGIVKLTGAVEERPHQEQMLEIARNCAGVVDVESWVTIGPNQIDRKQVAINLHRDQGNH